MQFLVIVAAIGAFGAILLLLPAIPAVATGFTDAVHGLSGLVCAVNWIVPVSTLVSCIGIIVGVYSLGLAIRAVRWLLDLLPLGGGF